jgi:hypothetical protein
MPEHLPLLIREVGGIWLPKELHQELKRLAEELKANGSAEPLKDGAL